MKYAAPALPHPVKSFTVTFEGPTAMVVRNIVACSHDITEQDVVHSWVDGFVRDGSDDYEIFLGTVGDIQRKRAVEKGPE